MANFKFNWKKIQLLVTQAAGAAPVLTTVNSLDPNSAGFGTLTPARSSAGVYTITSSLTPFTVGKTVITISLKSTGAVFGQIYANVTSSSVLTIRTVDLATAVQALADDILNGTIEIEVAQPV